MNGENKSSDNPAFDRLARKSSDLNKNRIYRFDSYELRAEEYRLIYEGKEIPLRPKAFEILKILVEKPNQLIRKEILLDRVWPETSVTENVLSHCIWELRIALDDHSQSPRYIQTIPTLGYRFIGKSRLLTPDADLEGSKTSEPSGWNFGSTLTRWLPFLASGSVSAFLLLLVYSMIYPWIVQEGESNTWGPFSTWTTLEQVSTGEGLQVQPTTSPMSNFVAYASDDTGNFDIWIQSLNGGPPIQMTDDPSHDWQPDWSPDGYEIIFRSERNGGGLFSVQAFAGEPTVQQITSEGFYPRWSPDGKKILFSGAVRTVGGSVTRRFYVRELDSGSTVRIFPELNLRIVRWHPDGRVSALSQFGNKQEFWTGSIDGTEAFRSEISPRVEMGLSDLAVLDFCWDPTGRSIFIEGDRRGIKNLYGIQVEPQTLGWTAGPSRITTSLLQNEDVHITRDGSRILFSAQTAHQELWGVPLDTHTGKIKGSPRRLRGNLHQLKGFDVSKNGKKIAFVERNCGVDFLYEESLSEGQVLPLTMHGLGPRWVGDDTNILFQSTDSSPEFPDFKIIPSGGGGTDTLSVPKTVREVSDISSDGRWLLTSQTEQIRDGPLQLWIHPAAGKLTQNEQGKLLLAASDYDFRHPRFSADNRWIVFIATPIDGESDCLIGITSFEGASWKPITDNNPHLNNPKWAPDSNIVYFSSQEDGIYKLHGLRIDMARGIPEGPVFDLGSLGDTGFEAIYAPGNQGFAVGRGLILIRRELLSGHIWVMHRLADRDL